MNKLIIYLTFDLDPPNFTSGLKFKRMNAYSNYVGIENVFNLIQGLEEKVSQKIPITIFLRNATVTKKYVKDHSIEKLVEFLRGLDKNLIQVGLHPHVDVCLDEIGELNHKFYEIMINNFDILFANNYKNRITRVGGNYYCNKVTQILNKCNVEVDSSVIFGRNLGMNGHSDWTNFSYSKGIFESKFKELPITTCDVNINGKMKRIYFDFSYNDKWNRNYRTLNLSQDNPCFVSITHPPTLSENIYKKSVKFKFGIKHWESNFMKTYEYFKTNFKIIEFKLIGK